MWTKERNNTWNWHGRTRGSPANKVKWYRGRNNAMAWQEYLLAHEPEVKGDRGWIKKEKAHTQVMPSPKKKRNAKNEDPMTHPRNKESNKQQNT